MTDYPEPTWTASSDQFVQRVSAFTENTLSVGTIDAHFIRYIQLHFSSPDNFQNSDLKTLLWNADPKLSKVFIGSGQADNVNRASQKPAIFVNSEEIKPVDPHIPPQLATVWIGQNPGTPPRYSKYLHGLTQIRCDSKMSSESGNMAEEVFYNLLILLPAFQEDMMFQSLDIALGKSGKTESGIFTASVDLTWDLYCSYINEEETPY